MLITFQPILMIDKNMQNSAIKIVAGYQYKSAGIHKQSPNTGAGEILSTTILIYGINKNGKTLIATCPLNTLAGTDGYTAMKVAYSVVTGIQVEDYPYICYDYSPSADFVRLKSLQFIAESRIYPDAVDITNVNTLAVLV